MKKLKLMNEKETFLAIEQKKYKFIGPVQIPTKKKNKKIKFDKEEKIWKNGKKNRFLF